jgi:predicted DNA-binding transcriptional regulator YafY
MFGLRPSIPARHRLLLFGAQPARSESKEGIAIDVASLCKLVEQMTVVSLKYGQDPSTAPVREIHPYAVGFTPSRNVLLFGLQVDGYSQSAQSDSAKGWRSFRTDKISSLVVRDSKFAPVQPQLPDRKIISEFACKNKLAL